MIASPKPWLNRIEPALAMGAVAIAWLALGLPARGDTLILKNGRQAEGILISKTDELIVFEAGGTKLKIPAMQVERIEQAEQEDNALFEVKTLIKGRHWPEAYAACERLANDKTTPEAVKEKAKQVRSDAVQAAVQEVLAEYAFEIKNSKFDICLAQLKARQNAKLGPFENLVLRIAQGNLHLCKALKLIDQVNYPEALAELDEIEKLDIVCPDYDSLKGLLLAEMDAYDKAAPHLLKAYRSTPDDPVVLSELFNALAETGQFTEAVQIWNNRPESFDTSPLKSKVAPHIGEAIRKEAWAKLDGGENEAAKSLFDEGFKITPPSEKLYQEAMDFHTKIEDFKTVYDLRDQLQQFIATKAASPKINYGPPSKSVTVTADLSGGSRRSSLESKAKSSRCSGKT